MVAARLSFSGNMVDGATVIESDFCAARDAASVTCAVKVEEPAVAGVPDRSPVCALRFNPEGSEPLAIDQVKGGVPPMTVS